MVPGSYIGENSLESTISVIKSLYVGNPRTFPTPWDISAKVTVESKLRARQTMARAGWNVAKYSGKDVVESNEELRWDIRSSCQKGLNVGRGRSNHHSHKYYEMSLIHPIYTMRLPGQC